VPVTEKGAAKLAAYLGVYFSRSKKNPTEVPELHSLPLPPRPRANREKVKPAKPAKPPSVGSASKRTDMQVAATPTKRQRYVAARSTSPLRSAATNEDAAEAEGGGSDANEAAVCAACGSAEDEPGSNDILLCDACDAGYHMRCLQPPLEAVPPGDWFCTQCEPQMAGCGGAEAGEEPLLLLKGPAHSEEAEAAEGQDCARTPPPRAEARPVASAKAARKAKSEPSKPVGRPYGSNTKANGRKEGQWYQGKYELQPDVSMVCLAAVDKETGHAERGVLPSPLSRHRRRTREIGGGHNLSSPPSPQLTPRKHTCPTSPPAPTVIPALPHLILRPATRSGCGSVLTPDKIRWVLANQVAHVTEGCPCAVIWTHGGGCPAGRDGLFRPAVLRPGWEGAAPPDGNIHAWRAVQAQGEQPHVGQYSGYRLHGGQPAVGAASASESLEAWRRRSIPAATTPAT